MVIRDLGELGFIPELAVIINVGMKTRRVATLALRSALRHANIPTLLVDCEQGSFDWFRDLAARHDFYLLPRPLVPHGAALDWLFSRITAERILLIDSDTEVLNPIMLERMRAALEDDSRMYGAGSLHEAHWLERHFGTNLPLKRGIGYYMERPWIPFSLLRVEPIRQAMVEDQCSFMAQLVLNEFGRSSLLARLLYRRYRLPYFRQNRLDWLDSCRLRPIEGTRPGYIHYDTAAVVHECLTSKGYRFGGIPPGDMPHSVHHFSGVSRSALHGDTHDAHAVEEADQFAVERLSREYP